MIREEEAGYVSTSLKTHNIMSRFLLLPDRAASDKNTTRIKSLLR